MAFGFKSGGSDGAVAELLSQRRCCERLFPALFEACIGNALYVPLIVGVFDDREQLVLA